MQICICGWSSRVTLHCLGRTDGPRYLFSQRLPGQPPIVVKDMEGEESDEAEPTVSGGKSDADADGDED